MNNNNKRLSAWISPGKILAILGILGFIGNMIFTLSIKYNDQKHIHETLHNIEEYHKKIEEWKIREDDFKREVAGRLGKIEGKLGIE